MIRDTEASTYFPEAIRDDCLRAYRQGQSKEDQSALTAEEVRLDGARKARHTYEHEQEW